MRLFKALVPLCLLLITPTLAFSLGSRIPDQDAAATGVGDAFAATADNASAVYYNPAGIMQLPDGLSTRGGLYGIWIDEQYDPLHGQEGAHSSSAHEPAQAVPNLFLSYHPKDEPFAIGFGVYSPFGLKTEWPDDASFRTIGVYGSEEFIAFNPVIALQATRSLSIALGISANYVDAQLRQGLSTMEGDSFSFKGDGLSVGGNAAILWKPTERQSIGITYHSPVSGHLGGHTQEGLNGTEKREIQAGNAQLAGAIAHINSIPGLPAPVRAHLIAEANAAYAAGLAASGDPTGAVIPTDYPTLAAEGNLHFPQYASIGYSFRPTPDWNVETDVDWTDWDSLNDVTLNRADGSSVKVPFNWTHSFLYEVGVTHEIGIYTLRAGYIYSENTVPSADFSPIVPDSARNVFSVGVGRSFGKCDIDLAYQVGIGGTRTIVNDSAADGRYYFLSNAVSISVGYHF